MESFLLPMLEQRLLEGKVQYDSKLVDPKDPSHREFLIFQELPRCREDVWTLWLYILPFVAIVCELVAFIHAS